MRKVIAIFLCCLGVLLSRQAFAQEASRDAQPIEGDASELSLPSTQAFEAEPTAKPGPWSVREWWKDSPAFFRDMTAKINVRTFYYNQEAGADAPGNDKERVSWALGGSAQLKSGKVYDVFDLGAEAFTSQKLYGPEDKDGAKLLEPGQEGYTVLGVLNPRFTYEGHMFTAYRQRLDLPYINSQENRMTPNTFENYAYAYVGEGDAPPFQYAMGYLDAIKQRDSDSFVSMSEAAGVETGDRGMPWVGARVRPIENLKLLAVDYVGLDFLNMFYTDAEYGLKLSEDWSLKSSLQFSAQESIGDDLLTGESVSASMWGAQQAVSFQKFMLRAAVTANDKGTTMRSPFGSYPGFNSSIVEDFNRAGEVAWKFGVSYDFAGVGIDGLSAYTDFIRGNRAVDDELQALNDKTETDVNIDYRIKDGWLEHFWLRLRGGFVHEDTVGTTKDFRAIVNYEIPIV